MSFTTVHNNKIIIIFTFHFYFNTLLIVLDWVKFAFSMSIRLENLVMSVVQAVHMGAQRHSKS